VQSCVTNVGPALRDAIRPEHTNRTMETSMAPNAVNNVRESTDQI